MKKLKTIIIGPGNIFNKAYLPFVFTLEELNIVGIVGRNSSKLQNYKEKYGFDVYTNLEEAIKLKPDCAFVHTSTDSHYEIAKKLIENGINVYVDKPITEDISKTKEIIDLAINKSIVFAAGFNRRYAPMYQKALNLFNGSKPDICIMEKNRNNDIKNDIKFTLYDDFIHVIDTLCYIIKDVTDINVNLTKEGNSLKSITIMLKSNNISAIGIMHRNSGRDYERLELHGNSKSIVVDDMENLKIMEKGNVYSHNFGSWDSISYRRGFVSAVKSFLDAVYDGKINYDELMCTLKTHEVIEKIVNN